jgi:hypothetical protein
MQFFFGIEVVDEVFCLNFGIEVVNDMHWSFMTLFCFHMRVDVHN